MLQHGRALATCVLEAASHAHVLCDRIDRNVQNRQIHTK